MNIERINSYRDARFSQAVLNQHGSFLANGDPLIRDEGIWIDLV